MRKYRVTITVTADEFMPLFVKLRGLPMDVEEMVISSDSVVKDVSEKGNGRPIQRRKRTSKVAETILASLKGGETDIPALKRGLSEAGLSENSLSTGLAILQKDGRVKRTGDGAYALASTA